MKRTSPEPETRALRYLFIAFDVEDPINMTQACEFTPTPTTDPDLYPTLLEHFKEATPYYLSDEYNDGQYLGDVLDYLCGDWGEERPPEALPPYLWFLPREKLGSWKELDADNYVNVFSNGPWDGVIIIKDSYHHKNGTFTNPEERMIDEQEWKDALADRGARCRTKEQSRLQTEALDE